MTSFGIEIDEEAICKVNKLHGFDVVDEYNDRTKKYITGFIVDRCRFCGEERVYKKWQGKIDNARQVRNRIRDTVQPNGRTARIFEWVYGVADQTGKTSKNDL